MSRQTINLRPYESVALINHDLSCLIRPIKPLCSTRPQIHIKPGEPYPYYRRRKDAVWDSFKTKAELIEKYCPYANQQKILWGREQWRPKSWDRDFDEIWIEYRYQPKETPSTKGVCPWKVWDEWRAESLWESWSDQLRQAGATVSDSNYLVLPDGTDWPLRWQSPVTMPVGLSRFQLKVKEISFKPFSDITEQDAIAAGIDQLSHGQAGLIYFIHRLDYGFRYPVWTTREPLKAFKWVWNQLYPQFPANTDPWVWLINIEKDVLITMETSK